MPEAKPPAPKRAAPKTPKAPSKKIAARKIAKPIDNGDSASALDTSYLESLLGYNARRAALTIIALFLKRMAPFGVKPVEFSVLTLIAHNPGATSRQICAALDILPPNLVGLIKSLDQRGLIVRKAHPTDGRAQGLHLSAQGKKMQREAQTTATALELEAAYSLSASELEKLKSLLRRVYQS